MTSDNIGYGLIRVPIQVDGNDVTRFVLIAHVGSNVSGLHKAQKVTHKGQLLDVIGQFHTDVSSESADEVNASIVAEVVARAAGTHDNLVRNSGKVEKSLFHFFFFKDQCCSFGQQAC